MADRRRRLAIGLLAGVLLSGGEALAVDAYPTPAWPADATIQALDGTTDTATGLPFIPTGTKRSSTPPAQIQIDRMFDRLFEIAAHANQLRVVQVSATAIGVYPGDYVLNGTRTHFDGDASEAVSTTDDTYYVYIDNANALQIVTDATDWPATITQFVPLAEVTVTSNVIASITDRRNWARTIIPDSSSGVDAGGTDEAVFTIDQDNAGAGANGVLAVNRGSTDAHDAGLRWNETNDQWDVLEDVTDSGFTGIKALAFESSVATGTAPLVVASTTKVGNLNADAVDGLGFTAPAAANGVAYSSSTSAVVFTAAPTAADVLIADGDGIPVWEALGEDSAVQAWDADLDAIAAVASAGVIARTGAGTASARTITAGAGIAVTDGDGVAGNPTIALEATTNHAVQVGNATADLTSLAVGASNTVLAGNTGADPEFRQIVNADIATSAGIEVSKLYRGGDGQILKSLSSGTAWSALLPVIIKTTTQALDSADVPMVVSNEGATSQPNFTLPAAVGTTLSRMLLFVAQDADGIKITAASGDTIRDGGTVSASGGYIQTTVQGATLWLISINATEWIVFAKQETWTIDS